MTILLRARPHRLRRPLQLLAFTLVLLTIVLPTGMASAAAGEIIASEPRNREVVEDPPGWVTLAFDSEVDPGLAKMLVTDASGQNVTTGALIVEGSNVTTQLQEDLAEGTYTVHYRINRSDGEPQGGAFQFAYGRGNFTRPADARWSGADNEPELMRDTDPNAVSPQPEPSRTSSAPEVEVERSDGSTETPDPGSADPTVTLSEDPAPSQPDTASPSPQTGNAPGNRLALTLAGVGLVAAFAVGGFFVARRMDAGRHQ